MPYPRRQRTEITPATLEYMKTISITQYFNGIRSYNATVLAMELALRAMELSKQGHLIVEDGQIVTPMYVYEVDDTSISVLMELGSNCYAWIAGCTRDEQNRTYATKKDVRSYFDGLEIYKVLAIKSLMER